MPAEELTPAEIRLAVLREVHAQFLARKDTASAQFVETLIQLEPPAPPSPEAQP